MKLGETLKKHGFVFNKRYGQNFISDGNLLRAIVADSETCISDTVIEIGAGAGTLTAALAQKARRVIAIEVDENLKGVLSENLAGLDNVTLIFADAMKLSPSQLSQLAGTEEYKVVANIPYYITTPLVMRFLEQTRAESLTVTVQKEVAERFTALPGSKNYGAVTVAVNALSDPVITRNISRESFFPVPNVDSAVVRMKAYRSKYGDYSAVREIVKAAFSSRRKTLPNSLSASGIPKENTRAALVSMGKPAEARAETLSPQEFFRLADCLNNLNNG